MAYILDYIDWYGDFTLDKIPFNDVDNLIFTQLCFADFSEIVPTEAQYGSISIADAAEKFLEFGRDKNVNMGVLVPNHVVDLFLKMAKSERYKNMRLAKYIDEIDSEKQQQFSAVTIILGNGTNYIAFRGTDDTIVGWKEDFNMSFITPVPSQISGVEYVNRVADSLSGAIILGGHSKGGNIAVFSGIYCKGDVKDRIIKIYNNDGPGFTNDILTAPDYLRISDRVKTIIPESSVVGMLLEHDEKYTIVKSKQLGILQHDAFTWEVLGPRFVVSEERSTYSEIADMALRTWINSLDSDERLLFVDTLFDLLECTDATTLTGFNSNKLKAASGVIKTIKNMSEEQRNGMMKIVGALFKDSAMAINAVLNENHNKKKHSRGSRSIKLIVRHKNKKSE